MEASLCLIPLLATDTFEVDVCLVGKRRFRCRDFPVSGGEVFSILSLEGMPAQTMVVSLMFF